MVLRHLQLQTVAYVNHQSSRRMSQLTHHVLLWSQTQLKLLHAVYVLVELNHADHASCPLGISLWSLQDYGESPLSHLTQLSSISFRLRQRSWLRSYPSRWLGTCRHFRYPETPATPHRPRDLDTLTSSSPVSSLSGEPWLSSSSTMWHSDSVAGSSNCVICH